MSPRRRAGWRRGESRANREGSTRGGAPESAPKKTARARNPGGFWLRQDFQGPGTREGGQDWEAPARTAGPLASVAATAGGAIELVVRRVETRRCGLDRVRIRVARL